MKPHYFVAATLIIVSILLQACGAPGVKTAPTASEQFALAKKEYDKKHYLKAIDGFQKVIFNFPGVTMVDTAQYYLAMSYYENEEYELASAEFNRLNTNYPHSDFVDDAQYMAGVCYFKNTPQNYALDQEDMKRAVTAMEDFITDNPDSPLITDARNIILQARTKLARKEFENGALYFKLDDYQAASIYFQLVIDEYTDTEYASKALFKLAESAYKQEKYLDSQAKFNSFISLYPSDTMVPRAKEYLEKTSQKLNTANASNDTK